MVLLMKDDPYWFICFDFYRQSYIHWTLKKQELNVEVLRRTILQINMLAANSNEEILAGAHKQAVMMPFSHYHFAVVQLQVFNLLLTETTQTVNVKAT